MDTININGRFIGAKNPVYIIAEMSANHGGSFQNAIDILHAAKEAGADCIKLQTYTADTMTINSDKSFFQINQGPWQGESLYQLYQRAYTPWEWQADLKKEAEKIGLDFLSTPFDETATDFLEEIGVDFYKIASFEAVDIPLIRYIARKGKPIILSTGMASIEEIAEAVSAIRDEGNSSLCLLRCSSAYPAIPEYMNLKIIPFLRDAFELPVGLSDHSAGHVAAVAATALGAAVIEKHFCITRDIVTPDSAFSMNIEEFREMVQAVRATEKSMGRVDFSISKKEQDNMTFRRSLFVVRPIKSGESFTTENVRSIRPAHGLKPKYLSGILGKIAVRDIDAGEPLTWPMIGE